MSRFLLSGLVLIGFVSILRADVPLPPNLQYVDPRVQFNGIDKHDDHVFFLRFLTFSGGPAGRPHTVTEVKHTKPFNLNAQRRLTDMSLIAVERKVYEKRAKDDPKLQWLTEASPGILRTSIATPSTTAAKSLKEVPVTSYQVSIQDGKLNVQLVKDQKRSDAGPDGAMPMAMVGIALTLSITFFGVWYARRHSTNG
jgi:hypothetical protein